VLAAQETASEDPPVEDVEMREDPANADEWMDEEPVDKPSE
jgi:hypothetical protein